MLYKAKSWLVTNEEQCECDFALKKEVLSYLMKLYQKHIHSKAWLAKRKGPSTLLASMLTCVS